LIVEFRNISWELVERLVQFHSLQHYGLIGELQYDACAATNHRGILVDRFRKLPRRERAHILVDAKLANVLCHKGKARRFG
jgi:hypothetical protein